MNTFSHARSFPPATFRGGLRRAADANSRAQRVIVWPDGHREIEGVTPKALPAPDGG
jgi:hypothetical protein